VVKWGNHAAAKPRSLHRKCYTAALVWRSRSISSLFCFVLLFGGGGNRFGRSVHNCNGKRIHAYVVLYVRCWGKGDRTRISTARFAGWTFYLITFAHAKRFSRRSIEAHMHCITWHGRKRAWRRSAEAEPS
jgi:hypothetical protein